LEKRGLSKKDPEDIKRFSEEEELHTKVKTASKIISKVGTENLTRSIRETRDEM